MPNVPVPPTTMATVTLSYDTPECSGYSGRYEPQLIKVENPTDQSSRWSGSFQGGSRQWILLELESIAVVRTIIFGKFHKTHPCNMKEFKVYVGLEKDHMFKVLHSSLKNDSIQERFSLQHANSAGVQFPTRYLKIVPVSPHGQSYHISIWHVALEGINEETYIERSRKAYEQYQESIIMRHILKHLRERRLLSSYNELLAHAGVSFEHPLVSHLHKHLVLDGNWSEAETLLQAMADASLFSSYLQSCQPHAQWKRIRATDMDGDLPSPRGGHAMCLDQDAGLLYLLGGWNGTTALDDFWVYNIREERWKALSFSTSKENHGPGPRSCHKMVFNSKTQDIFVLGMLDDRAGLSSDHTTSTSSAERSCEFYRYSVKEQNWQDLSKSKQSSGLAPPLLFDHQMVMDCEAQILYVFGGRVVDGVWDNLKYAGLYSYNVRLNKWRVLLKVEHFGHPRSIPSRFGHSMVLDTFSKTLFIFGGQRDQSFLSDMWSYDIATGEPTELYSNFTPSGGPDPCFTQRAVIDVQLREIYVFCGMTRKYPAAETSSVLSARQQNWLLRYTPRPGQWSKILPQSDVVSTPYGMHHITVEEPVPRYAAQVAYDSSSKMVYLHGGNAGPLVLGEAEAGGMQEKRLNDFWSMTLVRPNPSDVVRKAKYKIRQQQFREMCEDSDAISALNFLQTQVSQVVDHSDAEEAETFRSLLTHLIRPETTVPEQETEEEGGGDRMDEDPVPSEESRRGADENMERYKQRNAAFESVLQFVSADAKHPAGSMLDLVNLNMDSL